MERASGPGGVRLAELVAALSLGIDLGFSQPMEHVLRQCLIALRLADRVGVDAETRASIYYTAMLINVGCHSDAHEQAKWFGDDLALKGDKYAYGLRGLRSTTSMLSKLGAGSGPGGRVRTGFEFATGGYRDLNDMVVHHARLTGQLGAQLGLPAETVAAMSASYEQWDGRGWPGDLKGEEVPLASRLAGMAEFLEVVHRVHGTEAACDFVRRQRGKQLDPSLADVFLGAADVLLAGLDTDSWTAVIDAEPALGPVLEDAEYDRALTAVADFVDLKSPYTLGHSRAVADLVGAAAARLGMSPADVDLVRRSALVHAFGKLGVSNAILDKAPPLGAGERERLRMIPFVTHRMLRQSPALAQLGAIALQHAERLDGSGHPNGLAGAMISREARLLGAADVYQSLREPRPHREALSADEAAARLRAQVRAGRLDPDCVEAVLAAAGHRVGRRTAGPAGLTAREIDVLRLISRGLSTKEVAERLVISRKTVSNHVEHIYTKIGASNRATAALFATQHGLLAAEETAPLG